MDEINKLTSIIIENEEKILKLTNKANKYETKCFQLIEELDIKKKMLNDIYEIVNRGKKKPMTKI